MADILNESPTAHKLAKHGRRLKVVSPKRMWNSAQIDREVIGLLALAAEQPRIYGLATAGQELTSLISSRHLRHCPS